MGGLPFQQKGALPIEQLRDKAYRREMLIERLVADDIERESRLRLRRFIGASIDPEAESDVLKILHEVAEEWGKPLVEVRIGRCMVNLGLLGLEDYIESLGAMHAKLAQS